MYQYSLHKNIFPVFAEHKLLRLWLELTRFMEHAYVSNLPQCPDTKSGPEIDVLYFPL